MSVQKIVALLMGVVGVVCEVVMFLNKVPSPSAMIWPIAYIIAVATWE